MRYSILLLLFLFVGCISEQKKETPKLFANIDKPVPKPLKPEYIAKAGKVKEYDFKGVPVNLKFDQMDIKDVVKFLMDIVSQNYLVVDALTGLIDVDIEGEYTREQIIKMVDNILKSHNYYLQGDHDLYTVHIIDTEDIIPIFSDIPEKNNTYIYKVQYLESKVLKTVLHDVFPKLVITENKELNLLTISSDLVEFEDVRKVIKKLDIRPKQVLVSVTLLQVTLKDSLQYGVEYFLNNQRHTSGNASLLSSSIQSGFGNVINDGFKLYSFQKDVTTFITMLNSHGKVKVLSKPKLLVQDGKISKLQVGSDEPIRTGNTISGSGLSTQNIQYRDVGVLLEIECNIEDTNVVRMHIQNELSTIIRSSTDTTIDSPSFRTNKLDITTLINDSENIYIGGLISTNTEEQKKFIPYLSKIPYIGKAFTSLDTVTEKTELILLISVDIIHSISDRRRIKEKYTP